MRKLLLILLLLIILTICQANDEQYNTKASLIRSDYPTLPSKIEASSTQLNMFLEKGEYAEPIESVNIIIENSGNSDIYFGTPYAVEKYVDGQWFKVPFKDNVSSTSIGLHLKTGQTYTQKIILSLLDYEVNHGKYRIIKDFNTNDNVTVERIRITLAAEFEIKR